MNAVAEHCKIEVLKVHSVPGVSPLKCFVDLRIGPWTICGFRIIQQNEQRAYVQPPQTSWQGDDGKINYRPMVTVPARLKGQIDTAILRAWGNGHA